MLLLKLISLGHNNAPNNNNTTRRLGGSVKIPEEQYYSIAFWFYVLLRLIAFHRSTFSLSTCAKSDLVDQTRLLIAICCITYSPILTGPRSRPIIFPSSVPVPPSQFQNITSTTSATIQVQALDVAATISDTIPDETRLQCARLLRDRCPPYLNPQNDPHLIFIFGTFIDLPQPSGGASTPSSALGGAHTPFNGAQSSSTPSSYLPPHLIANPSLFPTFDSNISTANKLRFQQNNRAVGSYTLRPWEMLEESAPVVGVNDTALNLRYFGARRIRD